MKNAEVLLVRVASLQCNSKFVTRPCKQISSQDAYGGDDKSSHRYNTGSLRSLRITRAACATTPRRWRTRRAWPSTTGSGQRTRHHVGQAGEEEKPGRFLHRVFIARSQKMQPAITHGTTQGADVNNFSIAPCTTSGATSNQRCLFDTIPLCMARHQPIPGVCRVRAPCDFGL
jgi:hypothetical protein